MAWEFGKSYKLFYFQAGAGIPSTPQHTDSHSAPDRGGPVACLGGPVDQQTGSIAEKYGKHN